MIVLMGEGSTIQHALMQVVCTVHLTSLHAHTYNTGNSNQTHLAPSQEINFNDERLEDTPGLDKHTGNVGDKYVNGRV